MVIFRPSNLLGEQLEMITVGPLQTSMEDQSNGKDGIATRTANPHTIPYLLIAGEGGDEVVAVQPLSCAAMLKPHPLTIDDGLSLLPSSL